MSISNLIFAAVALALVPVHAAELPRARAGVLQLLDGSNLHGGLREISPTNGLAWEHPAAESPLRLTLTNVGSVRFDRAEAPAPSFKPSSRFHFKNGDELI